MLLLCYGVKANVGGKLAQVGSRLIDGAARKMADDFFETFSKRLGPQVAAADAAEQAEVEAHVKKSFSSMSENELNDMIQAVNSWAQKVA